MAFQAADRRGFQSANKPLNSSRQECLPTETARASAAQKRSQQQYRAAVWQPTRLQLHSNAGSDVGWIRQHRHAGTAPLWQQTQLRLFSRAFLRAPPAAPKPEVYLQLRKDESVRLVAADGSHRWYSLSLHLGPCSLATKSPRAAARLPGQRYIWAGPFLMDGTIAPSPPGC